MADFPLPSNVGVFKRVAGADPAANAEVTDSVPVATNEVQTITGTPSGTFALTLDGFTGPATLTTTATAQNVQDYLNAFPAIGPTGVVCSGGPLPGAITVTFSGPLVQQRNISQLAVAGGVTGLTFATTTQGTNAKTWLLLAVKLTLVQGATQTPQPILQLDDGSGGAVFYESIGSSAVQAVSTTCTYTFAAQHTLSGQIGATTNVRSFAPLANDVVLLPGWRIKTTTIGIGANSDYAPAQYYICELG